ncbi:hypothetical protein H5410_044650 [Solanum commersonii]|uniref:Uncharacterized protein n=1 Tax=Solanum commersonii TaxID=4109 RepID=A0A9J5XBI1_SOLCO|nr:hypothetical protein H5410_044650 [Solanum commersonii]
MKAGSMLNTCKLDGNTENDVFRGGRILKYEFSHFTRSLPPLPHPPNNTQMLRLLLINSSEGFQFHSNSPFFSDP